MKQLCLAALLLLATGAMAQTNSTTASGTALGNMQGNNEGISQAVIFDSPATVTSNINYSGTQTIKNVPSVNGPNLTTSNDTCMGSSSAGANGPGIGLSFGTTWTDEQCKRLKMSRELWNKGMKAASLAMDCMDPAARAALEMTGTRCPQSMTPEERVSVFGPAPQKIGAAAPAPAPAPVAALPAAPAASAPAVAMAPAQLVGTAAAAAARARLAALAAMSLDEAVLTPTAPNPGGSDAPASQRVAALTGVRP
ncbi:MAG TPA: hypothetical protein VGI11_09545 [Variovorax sp.]